MLGVAAHVVASHDLLEQEDTDLPSTSACLLAEKNQANATGVGSEG